MFCLSVLYPNQPDARFDLDYYVETHMRLVRDRLSPGGLVRFELAKGVAGWPAHSNPPYLMICHMYFNRLDDLHSAFGVHSAELIGDIQAYTNIRPQMQVSEILD